MNCVRSLTGIVAGLVLTLGPGLALAGGSVHGHGKVVLAPAPSSVSEVSIDAWLDDDGVAHGMMTFIGDVIAGSFPKGGPADPWYLEVTDLYFEGNTAYVIAVVVHSPNLGDIGATNYFSFTDNSGTGDPDEIDDIPIEAGNITVND